MRRRAWLLVAAVSVSVAARASAGSPAARADEPPIPRDDLVLWLDAGDAASRVVADGRVAEWRDRSPHGNHAFQADAAARPRLVEDAIGGRPALRFGGGSFLNLGRPATLDIPPGQPFTIFAVYRVDEGKFGTFLAQGGGPEAGRAYQFYTAAGRIGAVVHGVRREAPLGAGTRLVALVSDGRTAEMRHDGPAVRFGAGQGASPGDVLLGARRDTAENTGLYWPLEGDVAELLVYRAALDRRQFARIDAHLRKKYQLADAGPADFDALARDAERRPAHAAESLLRLAEKNELCADLAELAGELLDADDPFARGMAEWAVAMKVGGENNGQTAVWERDARAPWFRRYVELTSQDRLEADWVRQAVARGIHRDGAGLLADLDAMILRAERMAEDFLRHGAASEGIDARLAALRGVRAKLAEAAAGGDEGLPAARRRWLDARRILRDLALANPAADFARIVFLTQFTPHTVRNITRSYAWKHKPGGDIVILDAPASGGPARPLLAGRLGPGYVWGLDLWWDADRVVFGYARLPNWPPPVDTAHYAIEGQNVFALRKMFEPVRLYEAAIDGSRIVQLTDDPYWSDFEPAYTAAGDVVFASDRCGKAPECGNVTYDHTNPNLYLLSRRESRLVDSAAGEGLARYEPPAAVRRFTDSKDLDRYPASLDDGRIVYTHWEYQERHFMEVHSLWAARPDGSMSDALFKQHMPAPLALRAARSIPGTAKLVAVATGHHTFSYGPVVTVDPGHGLNSLSGLRVVTPGVKPQEGAMAGQPVELGGVPDAGGLYRSPWALSEDCFLAAYAYARPNCTAPAGVDSNGFGLYLIDAYGNRELLYRDPLLGCATPIPLRPRRRPPTLPETNAAGLVAAAGGNGGPQRSAGEAICYVADVYGDMPGIDRGTIKYLRVAQHVPWPYDAKHGTQDYLPGDAGGRKLGFPSWSPVRVLGTVPVEADGSAHFTVPADAAIYFQALDERQMEVRRMRSFVSLGSGEVRGCLGCHESQGRTAGLDTGFAQALRRPPSRPEPPPWGAERMLGYEWLVQPILDRRCGECHAGPAPEGGIDLRAVRAADGLLASYHTLFGSRGDGRATAPVLVATADRFSNSSVTRPKEFGSHRSRLIRVLLDDPLHAERAKLSPDEWTALVTWVDANAPYSDAFINKRPDGADADRRGVVE